jgi:hypothetical protein
MFHFALFCPLRGGFGMNGPTPANFDGALFLKMLFAGVTPKNIKLKITPLKIMR